MILKDIIFNLRDFLFPPRCLSCPELTLSPYGLCGDCYAKIHFITDPKCNICGMAFEFEIKKLSICASCEIKNPTYDFSRSLFKYDENSRHIIHEFKYNDKTGYAKFFANMLIKRNSELLTNIDFICSVPMHPLKRLFRLYNPPHLIAKEISTLKDISFIPDLLVKRKYTKSQIGLNREDRLKNLQKSLKFNDKYEIKGKNILLIDDVKTTGTTATYAANLLKSRGKAKQVILFTAAAT